MLKIITVFNYKINVLLFCMLMFLVILQTRIENIYFQKTQTNKLSIEYYLRLVLICQITSMDSTGMYVDFFCRFARVRGYLYKAKKLASIILLKHAKKRNMKQTPETSMKITNLSSFFCFNSQKKNIYLTILSNFKFFYILTI